MSQRYFVAGLHRLDTEEQDRLIPTSPEVSAPSSGPMSRVNALIAIARTKSAIPHMPVSTQPDYLELPEDDDSESNCFTIDNTPTPLEPAMEQINPPQLCPAHLDEMLRIVRTLRRRRADALLGSTNEVTPATVADHTEEADSRRTSNNNPRNFEVTNLADLMN